MLDKIIGQDKIKRYIQNELEHDILSYGYILEGAPYMGKNFIAHEIADEITVPSYIIDVLPTEGRKLLQVDDIRQLKTDAYSSSYQGCKKVYIIPDADKMTVSAQNAFLKLLEEPPQDCIFILLAVNKLKLLETIRSRCTAFTLTRYTDNQIENYTRSLGFNPDRESIKLCDGCINKWESISNPQYEKDIKELAFRILLNIRDLHPARIFAITKHLKKIKDNINDVLDIFIIFYRDVYVYQITQDLQELEFTSYTKDIQKLSNVYKEDDVLVILNKIQETRTSYIYNTNFDMSTEMLLLTMRGII